VADSGAAAVLCDTTRCAAGLEWWRAGLAVLTGFTACAPREGKRTNDRGSWGNDRARRKVLKNTHDLAGDLLRVKNAGVTKCEAFVLGISPGTNAQPQLYQMVCTGWMPGTYEGYQPVQMSVLLVVSILNYYERQRWSWSRRLAGEGWQSWSMQGASRHRLLFCFVFFWKTL
jgi:hypothetical protein